MKPQKPKRKVVGLGIELETIADALLAVEILAERMAHHGLGTEFQLHAVPRILPALISIIEQRLRLAMRVANGTVDPADLWCSENDAQGLPSPGVVLRAWAEPKK